MSIRVLIALAITALVVPSWPAPPVAPIAQADRSGPLSPSDRDLLDPGSGTTAEPDDASRPERPDETPDSDGDVLEATAPIEAELAQRFRWEGRAARVIALPVPPGGPGFPEVTPAARQHADRVAGSTVGLSQLCRWMC